MYQKTVSCVLRVFLIFSLSLLGFAAASAANPDSKLKKSGTPNSTMGTPLITILNINNFTSFMRADGQGNHQVDDQSGGRFPRGTSTAIYEDGFVWGGKTYLDANYTNPSLQLIRVGGQTYNQGTRQGKVNGLGASAVQVAPDHPDSRIYRIRRDYASMTRADLRADAATLNLVLEAEVTDAQIAAVQAQYHTDWTNWPVALGAPYIERNGTPGYQPPPSFFNPDTLLRTYNTDGTVKFAGFDEPGVAGADVNSPADQVVWTVYNDLDPSAVSNLYRSEPLGLEGQVTMWGYKRTDALGNLYFRRLKIINKGGVAVDAGGTKGSLYIDSMYVSQWSDPDLGDSGDDFCGSDTLLSLGFAYNGNAIDAEYRKFSLPPPAVGYDFLQGPMVTGAATDSAVFDLQRRYGKKNLPMTGFVYFSAGSPITDPTLASTYESTIKWYKMLRGYRPDGIGVADRYYPFPPNITPGPYCLTGDPVKRTGFIDGLGTDYSFVPGDRRIILTSGPFRLAVGDTQEVVVGTVAGMGSDRLSSVSVMKFNDRFVQNTYNALFAVPRPPAPPDVKYVEMDGAVIFEWGSNATRLTQTEKTVNYPGAYAFEGYNVYQLPSLNSQLSEGKLIKTFDLGTDPTVVLDEQFDVVSGQILQKPVQFGTNSGITRYYEFDRDYIRDIPRLNNGSQYYIAVTAYSVSQTGFLPVSLESPPLKFTVTPQKEKPGLRYGGRFRDTLSVNLTTAAGASPSDGGVIAFVVDASKLTGHTYEVTFHTDTTGETLWDLKDKTSNTIVLRNQTNQTGDEEYTMVDGMMIKVTGPPPGMKDWDIPAGTRRFTFADGYTNFEGFETTIGWDDPAHFFGNKATRAVSAAQLKNVVLKLDTAWSSTAKNPGAGDNPYGGWDVNNPAPGGENYSYAYRYLRGATAAAARPEFAPYIVNATAGYAYQDYKRGVPLSAWDMETNPPTRLAVGHLENNAATGLVDGKWWPGANGTGTTGNSGSTREWLFIFNSPYTGSTPSADLQKDILNNSLPVMWWLGVQRRGGANFSNGDQFLIMANHVNTPSHTFSFTAPTTTQYSATMAKQDVGKVNVFPNPYYAFNPREISRTSRFVTFSHLPQKATVRIFNLAGQLVRTLEKDSPSQYIDWNLANQDNFPVASGMYIVHVDMPDLGTSKVLKLAVIQEQEVPNNF